ncbi:MAG: FAD-binding oxidoreductase [Actinomycetia bacterium]|nr:FAD-binding oxidoreductase [Actinomycetes bacterium]
MTERLIAPSTLGARAVYQVAVDRLRSQYRALSEDEPVRLAKKTSNLFRMRDANRAQGLDVSAFSGVIEVDPVNRTADVLGMTTYEDLVDATLRHGLMPMVVPELKTITLGGAVTGLGIESTSFRHGCPHESVIDFDVLTGDGRVLTVTPNGPHADLFTGFPNSYGTLGYALRLRIELAPVKPFVALEHYPVQSAQDAASTIREVTQTRAHRGRPVDFLDGVVFSHDRIIITVGRFVDEAPYLSDYTRAKIYYKSLEQRSSDYLTIRDYLWRWDTDWFWCSRALGVQHRMVRPFLPRRLLRSDVYWKMVGFERRHGWKSGWDAKRGLAPREAVIQDVEVPVDRLAEFLAFFHEEIGIAPLWLCPLRQRNPDVTWDLYALDASTTYVNLGFWSSVETKPAQREGHHNRRIEEVVAELGGRKSLYSSSYYEPDNFWSVYNGAQYALLKKQYDPRGRLLDLYDKSVRGR